MNNSIIGKAFIRTIAPSCSGILQITKRLPYRKIQEPFYYYVN